MWQLVLAGYAGCCMNVHCSYASRVRQNNFCCPCMEHQHIWAAPLLRFIVYLACFVHFFLQILAVLGKIMFGLDRQPASSVHKKIPFFFLFILLPSLCFIAYSFPSPCMQGVVPYLGFVLLFMHFLPHVGNVPYLVVVLLFINFLHIFFFFLFLMLQ